jgi:hypothetical protein
MKMREKRCTARGKLVDPKATQSGAPTDEKLSDGQLADHYVLCQEDRLKGYVEPYRESYIHVGPPGPTYSLVDLTADQQEYLGIHDYVKYEPYPEGAPERPALGRYWTQEQLDKVGKGCGTLTQMPRACAETYAVQPGYYGSTFCCGCHAYFPVGRGGEFVWDYESMQRVGTHSNRS